MGNLRALFGMNVIVYISTVFRREPPKISLSNI